jgi:hypothetical protein
MNYGRSQFDELSCNRQFPSCCDVVFRQLGDYGARGKPHNNIVGRSQTDRLMHVEAVGSDQIGNGPDDIHTV